MVGAGGDGGHPGRQNCMCNAPHTGKEWHFQGIVFMAVAHRAEWIWRGRQGPDHIRLCLPILRIWSLRPRAVGSWSCILTPETLWRDLHSINTTLFFGGWTRVGKTLCSAFHRASNYGVFFCACVLLLILFLLLQPPHNTTVPWNLSWIIYCSPMIYKAPMWIKNHFHFWVNTKRTPYFPVPSILICYNVWICSFQLRSFNPLTSLRRILHCVHQKKDLDKDNLDLSNVQLLWKIALELNYIRIALNEGYEQASVALHTGKKVQDAALNLKGG